MPEVVATTQDQVLDAAIRQLRQSVPGATEKNCVVSLSVEPSAALSDNWMVIVAPMGGNFAQEFVAGGGTATTIEDSGILITLWSRIRSDQAQRATHALTEPHRGLLVLKRQVLKALTGAQLLNLELPPKAITTEPLFPVNCTEPQHIPDKSAYSIGLTFSTQFLWDLGE